jgi:hypothetical protein
VRLVDLNPRWFALPERHGQGVSFACPHCTGPVPDRTRLSAAFANPLDGGAAIDLAAKVLWPTLAQGNAPGIVTVPPGVLWTRQGDTLETLTLTPSIDASRSGHWHGFITNGAIA